MIKARPHKNVTASTQSANPAVALEADSLITARGDVMQRRTMQSEKAVG